jgi:hypothetical protein
VRSARETGVMLDRLWARMKFSWQVSAINVVTFGKELLKVKRMHTTALSKI